MQPVIALPSTPETLWHLFRQARRRSMHYWTTLGNACVTRHPAVARHALNSALPFLGNKKRARSFKIASQLCSLGDDSYLAAMKRIVATTMDHPGWWGGTTQSKKQSEDCLKAATDGQA